MNSYLHNFHKFCGLASCISLRHICSYTCCELSLTVLHYKMMFKDFKQSHCWNESLMNSLHKRVLSFIRYPHDYGSHQLECWCAGKYVVPCVNLKLTSRVISAAITMVKICT